MNRYEMKMNSNVLNLTEVLKNYILHINCDSICFAQNGLSIEIDLSKERIERYEEIVINGIRFIKEQDNE